MLMKLNGKFFTKRCASATFVRKTKFGEIDPGMSSFGSSFQRSLTAGKKLPPKAFPICQIIRPNLLHVMHLEVDENMFKSIFGKFDIFLQIFWGMLES